MLRMAVVGLLVLNLLFLGWSRGWFGDAWPPPGQGQREPERLAEQIHPERIVALNPAAAQAAARSGAPSATPSATPSAPPPTPAATPPALNTADRAPAPAVAGTTQCLEAGPFSESQVVAVSRALGGGGVDTTAVSVVPVSAPTWMVFAGRFASTDARRTRQLAWQRQNVPATEFLDAPPALAPGLVFSRHLSREAADQALSQLAQRYNAVASVARVVQTPSGAPRGALLRATNADAVQAKRLREFNLPAPGRFVSCVTG